MTQIGVPRPDQLRRVAAFLDNNPSAIVGSAVAEQLRQYALSLEPIAVGDRVEVKLRYVFVTKARTASGDNFLDYGLGGEVLKVDGGLVIAHFETAGTFHVPVHYLKKA